MPLEGGSSFIPSLWVGGVHYIFFMISNYLDFLAFCFWTTDKTTNAIFLEPLIFGLFFQSKLWNWRDLKDGFAVTCGLLGRFKNLLNLNSEVVWWSKESHRVCWQVAISLGIRTTSGANEKGSGSLFFLISEAAILFWAFAYLKKGWLYPWEVGANAGSSAFFLSP